METLRGVFPAVPTEALLRVLEVCDQSVALASTWLLENEWQELMLEQEQGQGQGQEEEDEEDEEQEQQQEDEQEENNQVTEVEAATTAAAARATIPDRNAAQPPPFLVRRPVGALGFDEQFDEEEEDDGAEAEDDDDEDEDEDEMYYDSGDEAAGRAGEVPPLVKRVKISKGKDGKAGDDDFWVAFDGQVVMKSMIELLNTTLSKLAHSKVVLLNRPAKEVEEAEAIVRLRSKGVSLSHLLNRNHAYAEAHQESGNLSCSSDSPTTTAPEVPVGQKRKRTGDTYNSPHQGFFAHFFPVRDLDMVWRTVMHAHLFKGRFGEAIEFHTACGGPKKDFDELLHIQNSAASSRSASLGFSPLGTLKCCLVLPCLADEEEILRIGKNIHSVLKVQGNLYFRLVDGSDEANVECPRDDHFELLCDGEKMTEERFRQFARYRVREEEAAPTDSLKESKVGVDPYMSYQQPRKPSYLLEKLEVSTWSTSRSS
ncbi:uncharacterized protein IUM83_09762 [Phytophthora cinnamomi]|uniref:uncharacterized protein n=1 Tax=Phytophthora cinnamomi TaxID=4785 RepID=UPI00355A88B0|nr:hypothetical protein IUM83_09762 [Phytophthora cinnamomi]